MDQLLKIKSKVLSTTPQHLLNSVEKARLRQTFVPKRASPWREWAHSRPP